MGKLQKGQAIKAGKLVGLKHFTIGHSITFTDFVHAVEWFSEKQDAVIIRYNDGQSITISAEENYVVVDNGTLAYDHMAFNFLGRGWEEKYNYRQEA